MKISSLLTTVAMIGLSVAASPAAFAQTTPPADDDSTIEADQPETLGQTETELESGQAADDETGGDIVVTGSRIRTPNLVSTVPITSVGVQELTDSGSVSLGDALNDLPSLRSTFSQSNSGRFIGTAGLNQLDLRGLGTERTLVLVNGRRHVSSSAGSFAVDVNTIPAELLERVDVVTGGNSAIYGSDAIAGVVNFILKRDFEGIVARAQGGISSRGDRGAYFGSITAGRNFADDRANIAISAEYSRSQEVLNIDRPFLSGAFEGFTGFVQTDNTIGEPAEGDGIPDNTLERFVRFGFISEGGTISGFCRGGAFIPRQPLACTPEGRNALFRFGTDGRLRSAAVPTRDLRATAPSNQIGGDGSTLSDTGQLFPPLDRYSVNLLSHFDVTEAFKPYFEAKYARIDVEQESSPSFFNGFCGGTIASLTGQRGGNACDSVAPGGNSVVSVFFDNPFLNPDDAAFIRALQEETIRSFGQNPATNPTTFFRLNRNNVDFGSRGEQTRRETYRFVGGVEGTFNDDWRYDVSATYGKFRARTAAENNLVPARLRNAVDAIRAPNGQIVCRINADAVTTNDDAACVPINILGDGAPSQAALDYVNVTSTNVDKASQLDVLAFVSGDLSQLFELQGGPVGFAVGGEYRREKSSRSFDELTRTNQTFLNARPNFNPPTFAVKEAFGELNIPLFRELPFAHELTLTAAGRVSDYNSGAGQTGTTYTYNVGGTYAPVSDLRFRANYSQAVRSPTPGALFSEQGQNFAFLTDPCDARFINSGSPNRVANCRANVPIGRVPVDYIQPPGNRAVLQGGNPLLEAETSKSLTVGGVFQPRFLRGFSLTVDYYKIKVNNLIANVSGSEILSTCFDSADFPNNQFCNLIQPRLENGNFNPTAALLISATNFAKLEADGIDFDAAFRRTLPNGHRINLRGIATYVIKRNNFLSLTQPDEPNRVKSELGDPEWAANFSAGYTAGPVTLGYSLRYIGKQTIGAFETQNSFNGNPPQNPDAFPRIFYPDTFFHDIRAEVKAGDDFAFYLGVDNVSDRLPPFGLTGTGFGSGIFDNVGRFFYAGARASF